jgi:hypothetical protein
MVLSFVQYLANICGRTVTHKERLADTLFHENNGLAV